MASGNVTVNIDLNAAVETFKSSFNDQILEPGHVTQQISSHLAEKYPDYNNMVIHSPHEKPDGCIHTHVEVPTSRFGTTGFEVYLVPEGRFTNLGDGGFQNWAFTGKFTREGDKVVRFERRT